MRNYKCDFCGKDLGYHGNESVTSGWFDPSDFTEVNGRKIFYRNTGHRKIALLTITLCVQKNEDASVCEDCAKRLIRKLILREAE
jgi:hypothetical protein